MADADNSEDSSCSRGRHPQFSSEETVHLPVAFQAMAADSPSSQDEVDRLIRLQETEERTALPQVPTKDEKESQDCYF